MPKVKKGKSVVERIASAEIISAHELVAFEKMDETIKGKYDIKFYNTFCAILIEMSHTGLSLEESAALFGYDGTKLTKLIESDIDLQNYVQMNKLRFKRNLLRAVTDKAKSDDKLAQWLLERTYPEEYGNKRPNKGNSSDLDSSGDVLKQAIFLVMQGGDKTPLVKTGTQSFDALPKGADYTVENILDQ